MKIGLKELFEFIVIYNGIGSITFFIYYYLGKRWTHIFGAPNEDHLTSEFVASCILWPIVIPMLMVDYIKGEINFNPIKFLCKKIDKIVDKQQGKLNKDIIINFKVK